MDKDDKEDGASVFVSYIAGQQSADPSPAVPPAGKGRRLKMVEESPSATPESPKKAPATAKRGGRARKAK